MMTDVLEEKELYLAQFTRFEKEQAAAPAWLQQLRRPPSSASPNWAFLDHATRNGALPTCNR